jgi:hypothetical protein
MAREIDQCARHPMDPLMAVRPCTALLRARQYMYCPPLTETVDPVMKSASSATRNSTTRATSSGLPRRPAGMRAMIFSNTWGGDGPHHLGVDIARGDQVHRDSLGCALLRQ